MEASQLSFSLSAHQRGAHARLRGEQAAAILARVRDLFLLTGAERLSTAEIQRRLARIGVVMPAESESGRRRQLERLLVSRQAVALGFRRVEGLMPSDGGRPAAVSWRFVGAPGG
jgi:hypothetical protein